MILFWDCPNSDKWPSYLLVDKELKHLKINTVLPSKSSWEFSRKEYNNDDNQPIHLTYSKCCLAETFWPFQCITRLITNHAPIGEYRLRFFPKESSACLCGNSPIKTRMHILHECVWYKKSWNPKRESLKDVQYRSIRLSVVHCL